MGEGLLLGAAGALRRGDLRGLQDLLGLRLANPIRRFAGFASEFASGSNSHPFRRIIFCRIEVLDFSRGDQCEWLPATRKGIIVFSVIGSVAASLFFFGLLGRVWGLWVCQAVCLLFFCVLQASVFSCDAFGCGSKSVPPVNIPIPTKTGILKSVKSTQNGIDPKRF